jgi:hypothetical protein
MLTCMTLGIITTRTLFIGSSLGLSAAYMLKSYVPNSFSQNDKQ